MTTPTIVPSPSTYWALTVPTTGAGGRNNPDGYYKGRYPRREPLSGIIGVHTTEGLIDLTPPDDGAEATARYFSQAAVSASYNEIYDSDGILQYLPPDHEAWHIAANGFNRHAWGASMAYHAADWGTRPTHERLILGNASWGIARQIARLEDAGIDVPLRWLTRDQALARLPGLVAHGTLQGDRSDPFGTADGLRSPWDVDLIELIADRQNRAPAIIAYGDPTDQPFVGHWASNNPGHGIGVRRGNQWLLRYTASSGIANIDFSFGKAADDPLVGDWNGDGLDGIGIRRRNVFHLRQTPGGGPADIVFSFGEATDIPLVGDWNGDGRDGIGVYRPSTREFLLRNYTTPGPPDHVFAYGPHGATPIVGDWTGTGADRPGVRLGQTWYLRHTLDGGPAHEQFVFGRATDTALVADWDGDGDDRPGVVRVADPADPNHLVWYPGG